MVALRGLRNSKNYSGRKKFSNCKKKKTTRKRSRNEFRFQKVCFFKLCCSSPPTSDRRFFFILIMVRDTEKVAIIPTSRGLRRKPNINQNTYFPEVKKENALEDNSRLMKQQWLRLRERKSVLRGRATGARGAGKALVPHSIPRRILFLSDTKWPIPDECLTLSSASVVHGEPDIYAPLNIQFHLNGLMLFHL